MLAAAYNSRQSQASAVLGNNMFEALFEMIAEVFGEAILELALMPVAKFMAGIWSSFSGIFR
jgi:hypothetical protein